MKRKIWSSLFFLFVFLMSAGSSFAASYFVYDGGSGWTQGASSAGGGTAVVLNTTNSCGYNGSMRYAPGPGTTSDSYQYGRWNNPASTSGDKSFQYHVYIPNCHSSAQINYVAFYNGSSTQLSVNQNLYSDQWISLGTYFISTNQISRIGLDNYHVSTSYEIGWDDALFTND